VAESRSVACAAVSPSASSGSVSKWRNVFIIGWIGLQVALPLSYYLGDDRFDERFAWRMFSPVRLSECRVKLVDRTDGAANAVRPSAELHEVWSNLLSRARASVVRAYAKRWCERRRNAGADAPALHAEIVCENPARRGDPACAGALIAAASGPSGCTVTPIPPELNLCEVDR